MSPVNCISTWHLVEFVWDFCQLCRTVLDSDRCRYLNYLRDNFSGSSLLGSIWIRGRRFSCFLNLKLAQFYLRKQNTISRLNKTVVICTPDSYLLQYLCCFVFAFNSCLSWILYKTFLSNFFSDSFILFCFQLYTIQSHLLLWCIFNRQILLTFTTFQKVLINKKNKNPYSIPFFQYHLGIKMDCDLLE